MKKKTILICSLIISSVAYSQVGINTTNPQGTFHVDGAKDNPSTGAPSVAQQANDFTVTPAGAVGIGVTVPTNTLDVNGTARIRTINPASSGTVLSSVYVDATGVVMKQESSTTGEVRSHSGTIGAGVNGLYLSGIPNGLYRLTITNVNGCGDATTVNYLVHSYSTNSYYGLKGINGFLTSTFGSPIYTQTARNTVAVTWSGLGGCADGGNATAFNYTVTMPTAGQINIINNGNVARNYKVTLTRND
ncbi:hypothetical protein FW781_01900 (plasmid) [Chryseobacterium panacisoli]|uniref:SprB repeat-containing protein n=1 Tax=Chryseobacterium panacisoli TaxID=1807141 RepID=A0A5D8ZUT9_9FLAO|nr:hypothetical protein [Chryseobacterium panacisoli]TZF98705.1 hypothetical protein FW781_01900 [Chryseobacterium panacisoli]